MVAPTRRNRKTKPTWQRNLKKAWKWICERAAQVSVARAERKLKLVETVSLGDKRFVAVLQFEGERFLVSGAAGSVSLLARLGSAGEFAATLDEVISKNPASDPASFELPRERMIV